MNKFINIFYGLVDKGTLFLHGFVE